MQGVKGAEEGMKGGLGVVLGAASELGRAAVMLGAGAHGGEVVRPVAGAEGEGLRARGGAVEHETATILFLYVPAESQVFILQHHSPLCIPPPH